MSHVQMGYDESMSENSTEGETPEVGLISDEELPEDLQPGDDNPLAKDPDADDDSGGDGEGSSSGDQKVEGMPDMGEPGA